MGLCMSVSVTSQSSIKTTDGSRWVLAWELSSNYHIYTELYRNSGISKNKGTSLRNFVQNSGLRKFCNVETCYQLSSTKVDARSVINWTVVDLLN